MIMSQFRSNEAGRSRPSSATTMNSHQKTLHERVTYLEQELLLSEAKAKKVTDQLNCLIHLVKRAWKGDNDAALNVANIVGVAPPDFEEVENGFKTVISTQPKTNKKSENENEKYCSEQKPACDDKSQEAKTPTILITKRKSRALNNWAMLAIGLLNREYRNLEEKHEVQVKHFLQQRQQFLDEQLLYHRDMKLRDNMRIQEVESEYMSEISQVLKQQDQQQMSKVEMGAHLRRVKILNDLDRRRDRGKVIRIPSAGTERNDRPQSCKTRSPPKHLYRPAYENDDIKPLTWTDLVVEAKHPTTTELSEEQNKISGDALTPQYIQGRQMVRKQRLKQYTTSYDDPHRYTTNGLFDPENALGPGKSVFRKRPPSAKEQREADDMRARPRSAVIARRERPLKYETTRPVSAVVRQRPPSGKTTNSNRNGQPVYMTEAHEQNGMDDGSSHHDDGNSVNEEEELWADVEDIVYDDKAFANLGIDLKQLEKEVKQAQDMKINTQQPQSVLQFEEDMRNMHQMEKSIKKTTLDLQRKLGIGNKGLVC